MPETHSSAALNRRFCVAPMLDWTDRHCRYFHRLLSHNAVLYTEMVTTGALLHAEPKRFLQFDPFEQPVALQLGGSDPAALAECARMAEQWGYNEVNLNVGCPSDRVQNGMFGACLMADPARVRDCMRAMIEAVSIPVTVKHRIGIDDQDSYEFLRNFVDTVADSGCTTFIVHARKAILQGLSPKQNREIPPLIYDRVYQLKQELPQLEIIINGGIQTLDQCEQHLNQVDGVMVGREAYQNPLLLADVDHRLYGTANGPTDLDTVISGLLGYVQNQLDQGAQLGWIARHLLGLFQGRPGARRFRRHISENAFKPGAGIEVLQDALALVNIDTHAA
ncbi:tRNA dihydrouridine(20/20a) synthase DusA [Motiliproteus sediminis]|uniref:tRNA dihydrouridine(20/20a) synthase DusA n=1 Tax=Motiliproteus sediminis TaxID=1468178 RepID=UPI001AEF6717|nr:tRNA dihydrouridine(20/20a) synthase DusA [Motiliproteus sediminis]